MKTKAKKFSHKLLALLMAVIMGLTCFSGVISAYGAKVQDYHDGNVEYNNLAWDILSDEQVATALLDYADEMLADFGPKIDNLLNSALPSGGMYYYNLKDRVIGLNVAGIIKTTIKVYTHSVDELMETLESVASTLDSFKSFIGNAKDIQLGSVNGVRRNNTSSCDIIRDVLGILQKNVCDENGKDVIGQLLRGGFSLGTVGNVANLDIYKIIGDLLGLENTDYKNDLVYNLVQHILFNYTDWFTPEEKAQYRNGTQATAAFKYDTVLLQKLTVELLDKINVLVTYADGTSSKDRRDLIDAKMAEGMTYAQACNALGYDPNLIYSEENKGNILLFAYGADKIQLRPQDSLFSFGFQALDMAWDTVLKDTVKLLYVNFSREEQEHGTNFDNAYYQWYVKNVGAWDYNNLSTMYSTTNVENWMKAVYATYDADNWQQFRGWVQDNLTYDRTLKGTQTGSWKDIEETQLFNKTRYSMLADYYFDMQTGPINLYFRQTGTPNLDAFFADANYRQYSSLVGGLNDCLLAAVKDIFRNSDNIMKGDGSALTLDYSQLETVNPTTANDAAIRDIAGKLTRNACKVIQYTADAMDANILKAFYTENGDNATLSEANLERAMMPLLIACIGQVNLGSGKLERLIHAKDWDGCKDAEAVAFVALREYLSYVIPGNDYNDLVTVDEQTGEIHATLNGTLMPMARDAVIYICQSLVPITYGGQEWKAEDPNHNQNATIFDLLNSVVAYYAGDYNMKKGDGSKSMGVAAILGICDNNGVSTITVNENNPNQLFDNIDRVANKLLPILGTLQGKGYQNFSSYDLIWNDIVQGVLEIGNTDLHESGLGGVSNFVYRFLSIISAEPIQSRRIVYTVYDVLADLINGLFGPRYNSSAMMANPVPARSSENPFDDFFHANVLVGTNGGKTQIGALQRAVYNFVAFFGYGKSGPGTFPDSMLKGIAFALQAVNSFVPEALNNIADHQLKLATARFNEATKQGCSANTDYNFNVIVKNNSFGVNNAYVDGMANEVVRMSRYYFQITGCVVHHPSGNTDVAPNKLPSGLIAPGKEKEIPVTIKYSPTNNEMSASATVTYNICDENGNSLGADYEGLTVTAYIYMTSAKGWQEIVYPSSRNGMLNANLEFGRTGHNDHKSEQDYWSFSSVNFREGKLYCTYPEYLVITTADPYQIEKFQFRINNENLIGDSYSVDGFYCYDEKSVVNDAANGAVVTVGTDNAIPIFDKETGDVLKYGLYDLKINDGEWGREGWDEDTTSSYINNHQSDVIQVRTHVAYTINELIQYGMLAAWHQNEAGVVEYVYLKPGDSSHKYDTTLGQVSLRGPIAGIYLAQGKVSDVPKNGSKYTTDLFKYDGETPLKKGTYPVKLCCYSSKGSGFLNSKYGGCTLVIGDNGAKYEVEEAYNQLATILANYRQSDFTSEAVYNEAKTAMVTALASQAAAITPTSALELSDDVVLTATKDWKTSEYGDKAFEPFTESNWQTLNMPVSVYADAYHGTADKGVPGVLYFDEECTMPIYAHSALVYGDDELPDTVFDVEIDEEIGEAVAGTIGYDAAGIEVILGEDGVWYLHNEPVYKTVWDTTSYDAPYKVTKFETVTLIDEETEEEYEEEVPVAEVDSKGNPYYAQVQYVYRDANGYKVNSGDNWACKFPVTSYQCIPNTGDGDHRGMYSQAKDYLAYVNEMVKKSIDTSIAQRLFEDVSSVRYNLNQNNFEIVTYNKMVSAAKAAERQYTLNITYTYQDKDESGKLLFDEDKNPIMKTKTDTGIEFKDYKDYEENADITITNISTTSTLSSMQVTELVRLFEFYLGKVVERGYIGDQLEAEILCASGNSYDKLTTDEDGNVYKTAISDAPRFGAWDNTGKLVNTGDTVYTEASWNNYVSALAKAVDVATLGNSNTYTHKDAGYYVAGDDYGASVARCYYADSPLQIAENLLEVREVKTLTIADIPNATVKVDGVVYTEPVVVEKGVAVVVSVEPDDGYTLEYITVGDVKHRNTNEVTIWMDDDKSVSATLSSLGHEVSASIVVATNPSGATKGTAVNGNYTVTIYNADNDAVVDQNTFEMAKGNNTFSFTLPAGNFYAVITSPYAITRDDITITVGDSDLSGTQIPMIVCDFKPDGVINAFDTTTVYLQAAGAGALYCDLNGDDVVNAFDTTTVYVIAAGTPNLAPIEIK